MTVADDRGERNGAKELGVRSSRPTLRSIAELAGVSYSSAARVLSGNDKYHVSPKMRRHIMRVAQEHGYSTDPFARHMRKRRSNIVGICVHMTRTTPVGNYGDRFNLDRRVFGIHASMQSPNYNLMMLLRNDTDPDLESRMMEGVAYLDGLIYSYPNTKHRSLLLRLAERVPIVLEQGEGIRELCSVSVDQYGAIGAAARLLVNRGSKHLALITHYGSEYYHNRVRLKGFHDAVQLAGLAVDDDQAVMGCVGMRSAFEAATRLLRRKNPVDGIIVPRDAELAGVVNAIEELGLTLGENVRLISVNETELSRHMKPGISVVRFPTEQVAREAFELLLRLISGQVQEPEHILVPATIVERQSTAGHGQTAGDRTSGDIPIVPGGD